MMRLIILSLWLLFSGCASVSNHAQRLVSRSDFQEARAAAPEWCRDALKTINQLEYELERK